MARKQSLHDEGLSRPITLPPHPYIAALKDFGSDEFFAGCIDVLSTAAASVFLTGPHRLLMLPFVGPILEKVGLYARHFYLSWKTYKTLPDGQRTRENFWRSFYAACRKGSQSLIDDLTVHDPVYIALMALGLHLLPGFGVIVISLFSYLLALLAAAGFRVARKEFSYWRLKKSLMKRGFGYEAYYESRFYLPSPRSEDEIISLFSRKFGLDKKGKMSYTDKYFSTCLPEFSGRKAKMRLRSRQLNSYERKSKFYQDSDMSNSLQIIYTRADEKKVKLDQCRYFPVRKEKFYMMFAGSMRWNLEDIEEPRIRKFVLESRDIGYRSQKVTFMRRVAYNDELMICVDKITSPMQYMVVELKVKKDTDLMIKAMRCLMVECPVSAVQTTSGKSELRN